MSQLTPTEFGALFRTFKQSAFRLETLQHYDSPSDATDFAAFLEGGRVFPNWPWCDRVRSATRAGKHMQRVRIVRDPLTEYTRFELQRYIYSAEAGEDIRVTTWDLDAPLLTPDFWLFDDHIAVQMRYDRHGRYLSAWSDDSQLAACQRERDAALERALPLSDYLTTAGV